MARSKKKQAVKSTDGKDTPACFSLINVGKTDLDQHVKQLRGCGTVVARPLCMRKVRGSTPRISIAFVSERSKELDSSSSVFALVGSNPTECIFLM
eukprot:scaffold1990_cov115-Skeletonema_dohrnii-CCMP3373.AAC.8